MSIEMLNSQLRESGWGERQIDLEALNIFQSKIVKELLDTQYSKFLMASAERLFGQGFDPSLLASLVLTGLVLPEEEKDLWELHIGEIVPDGVTIFWNLRAWQIVEVFENSNVYRVKNYSVRLSIDWAIAQ